jgi:cell division protease FtsH
LETDQSRGGPTTTFSLWYFAAVMLFMLMLQSVLFARHVETLAYSDFKTLLQSGRIKEVVISDDMVSGTVDLRGAGALLPTAVWTELVKAKDDLSQHPFVTVRVADSNLVPELQAAKVRFSAETEHHWLSTLLSWVGPAIVFFVIWGILMRRMGTGQLGGLMDIGKSRA